MDNTKFNLHPTNETELRLLYLMERLWNLSAEKLPPGELDLTMSQLRLIDFVGRHAGCHLQDVAEGLQLTPPTVSVAIRKLEESGWLERRSDPEDGRATCVFLTKKSETAVEMAVSHQKKIGKLFFSGLTDTEQRKLLDLLEKGISSMEGQFQK
jgi:DNA-binding MarR family transcriptional regulator